MPTSQPSIVITKELSQPGSLQRQRLVMNPKQGPAQSTSLGILAHLVRWLGCFFAPSQEGIWVPLPFSEGEPGSLGYIYILYMFLNQRKKLDKALKWTLTTSMTEFLMPSPEKTRISCNLCNLYRSGKDQYQSLECDRTLSEYFHP